MGLQVSRCMRAMEPGMEAWIVPRQESRTDALAALALAIVLLVAADGSARDQPVRASGDRSAAPAPSAADPAPFAVVELFTSEGCSSCPPADRLLGEIAARARGEGERVFALAFHVDYWNGLGLRRPLRNGS